MDVLKRSSWPFFFFRHPFASALSSGLHTSASIPSSTHPPPLFGILAPTSALTIHHNSLQLALYGVVTAKWALFMIGGLLAFSSLNYPAVSALLSQSAAADQQVRCHMHASPQINVAVVWCNPPSPSSLLLFLFSCSVSLVLNW